MSHTPRSPRSRTPSRVPSRSSTPVPGLSPSRLPARPVIHPVPSISSLRVYSYGSSAVHTPNSIVPPGQPDGGEGSSGSSVAEGILVQESDADMDIIDGEQGSAGGLVEFRAANEESKKNLREQLRRTLSKKESSTGEYLHHCPVDNLINRLCGQQTCRHSGDTTTKGLLCKRLRIHQVSHL